MKRRNGIKNKERKRTILSEIKLRKECQSLSLIKEISMKFTRNNNEKTTK